MVTVIQCSLNGRSHTCKTDLTRLFKNKLLYTCILQRSLQLALDSYNDGTLDSSNKLLQVSQIEASHVGTKLYSIVQHIVSIVISCIFAERALLGSKKQNQDNVSKWSVMSTC